MSTKEAKPNEQQLEEVTLAKAHTHEGVDYPAGGKIKVSQLDKEWLTENEVIPGKAPAKEE